MLTTLTLGDDQKDTILQCLEKGIAADPLKVYKRTEAALLVRVLNRLGGKWKVCLEDETRIEKKGTFR